MASTDAERARVAALASDTSLFLWGVPDLAPLLAAEAVVTDPLWREELLSRRLNLLWISDGPRRRPSRCSPTGPRSPRRSPVS